MKATPIAFAALILAGCAPPTLCPWDPQSCATTATPSPVPTAAASASSVQPSATGTPAPTPTQGPVHYGGTGGHGLFGPFYLEAGIHQVKYTFASKNPDKYSTHYYFQASLVGTAESNFGSKIVESSADSLDDFNNIQVPYSGSYWIELDDSQGDWQIDIDPTPTGGSPSTAPAGATPTPGANAGPSDGTSQLATIAQFNAVSVGMTYAQVSATMGSAGAKTSEMSLGGSIYTTYEWVLPGCSDGLLNAGEVEFTDGKVTRSYQTCP